MSNYNKKIYLIKDCITFRRTHEEYGGLSNMAGGYPIYIEGVKILTSEALYQACRFSDYPEIQKKIIDQRSPMTAKDISRKYDYLTRKDWKKNRVQIELNSILIFYHNLQMNDLLKIHQLLL